MEVLLTTLGVLLLIGMLLIYTTFSWGFVLYKFYYWFLLPIFPQMPHIDFYQAIVLCLFISLFNNHNSENIKDEYKNTDQEIILLINPWLTVGLGYIIWQIIK